MGDRYMSTLILLTALGSGLVAGVFFAFSSFVMKALGKLPANEGISAMQSINIVVLNPVFLGVMLGTAVACGALVIISLLNWGDPRSGKLLVASLVYLVGTLLVTMAFNVPWNNALAAVDPGSAEGARLWAQYLDRWTIWNHVRGAAAVVTAALLTVAL
ncbi:MAG: DUF1772 domain-containing protein [Rhizobiales bacterium]|nr:DUF1772 domain-containing protein [Hyphomicrobiales bacterium]